MTKMRSIVLGTGNAHKVAECQALFGPHGFVVHGAPAGFAPVEDGLTFEANAILKVRALRALVPQTKAAAYLMADDSGLVVPSLEGAPGVHSARFAQDDLEHAQNPDRANCHKLLAALAGRGGEARRAFFVCVLAVLAEDDTLQSFVGEVHGHIALSMRGEQGFGYDPLFVPEGHSGTFAELGAAVKHRLSHRARAASALLDKLKVATPHR